MFIDIRMYRAKVRSFSGEGKGNSEKFPGFLAFLSFRSSLPFSFSFFSFLSILFLSSFSFYSVLPCLVLSFLSYPFFLSGCRGWRLRLEAVARLSCFYGMEYG